MYHIYLKQMRDLASGEALKLIDRLAEQMSYAAPEVQPNIFWFGSDKTRSITSICNEFFADHETMRQIFHQAAQYEMKKDSFLL